VLQNVQIIRHCVHCRIPNCIEFAEVKKFRDYLANPGAFASAAPAAAPAKGGAPAAAAKKEEPKKEKSSEESMGGGFSMFD